MAWKTLPPATRVNVVKELHDDDIEFIRSKVYTAYSDMRGVEYDGHGIRLRAVQDRVKILRALRSEDPYRSNKQERDRLEMYLDCLEKMLPNLMGDVRFYGANDGTLDDMLAHFSDERPCFQHPAKIRGADTIVVINIPSKITPLLLEELKRQFSDVPGVFEFSCSPEHKNVIYIRCIGRMPRVFVHRRALYMSGRAYARHLKNTYLEYKQERDVIRDGNKHSH